MKRYSWSDSHRRSGPEAVVPQAWTGQPRPAPGRHRPGYQRPAPFAIIDDRRQDDEPASYSGDQPRHRGARANNNDALHAQALGILTAVAEARDDDAERHQQAEFKRIRDEVLDIAREVAALRRRESGHPAAADLERNTGFERLETTQEIWARDHSPGVPRSSFASGMRPDHRNPFNVRDFTVRDIRNDPAQAPAVSASEVGNRPREQRQRVFGQRRHQPADWTPRKPQVDTADTATAAPAFAARAPLVGAVGKPSRQAPLTPGTPAAQASERHWSLATAAVLAVLTVAGAGLITINLWDSSPWLAHSQQKLADMFHRTPVTDVQAAQPASSARQLPPAYSFAIPDTYGVYAVSDDHLTPLEPLPVRVPDARVSISSEITKPAPAPITNGRVFFVVYHRDLANSVPESASVRVVAKVMQATAFTGGKPKSIAVEDTWAVRGGSFDLRIAPVAANQEMIIIRPADPTFSLSPGRYVLMFKNQAYDFSVAGTVSDTSHCLERADLQDGSVFSECRELPALPITF